MSLFFTVAAYVLGTITWLWTTWEAWNQWGIAGAAASAFIPPLDLIFMFILGTWPLGIAAVACFLISIFVPSGSKD